MNPPDIRLNPHLEAALQRIRTAAEQAAERGAEGMGLSALSASQTKRRDELLAAQFLFRKQQVVFGQHFYQSLRKQLAAQRSPEMAAAPAPKKKDWTELSLMGDEQVESLVAADRIGMAIGHQSEWELREVDSYIANLSGNERNPLRPEVIAQGLLDGVNAVTEDAATRQVLTDELTRALSQEMRACYADIAELFRSRGLRPQDLRVRAGVDPLGHSTRGSGPGTEPGALDGPDAGPSGRGGWGGPRGGGGGGQGGGFGNSMHGGLGGMPGGGGRRGGGSGGGFGSVDVQMMDLLRRLAQVPSGHGGLGGQGGDYNSAWSDDYGDGQWNGGGGGGVGISLPPNLIVQHREELRQASTGNLDHMVIDVVGSLFDQILSDPKVPPQMARLIARLQLPVLRVALGDNSFFSSRKHPVRRFVNRIASLACAFDDFTEDPGKAFLSHVRDLVQDVANGDFDRMDVYESKLDALEHFIGEQASASLQAQGDATLLVARKETDLRLQQRYMQQLQQQLAPVPMHDFLRDFLAQVWSQAIVLAARDEKQPERAQRLRQLGRQLVMSVQPKAGSDARKTFLAELPILMRTLNEGLDLIQWPEAARKPFFGQLLPAHAESLKVAALTALDYNLLAKQLDQVFGYAPPEEKDLPAVSSPVDLPEDTDLGSRLSAAEAQRIGLMDETKVDWSGKVDIDLAAEEAPLQAVDISIDGLPAVEEEPEPNSGVLLIDNLQLGFAYNMLTGDDWHKMRLAHISAGRSFFIFTEGSKHQQTVTMTARMLRRLCESGRLRAFENAYLLERATARTRKQLAALGAKA